MSVRGLTPWATLEVDYNYILALYKYPQSVRYLMLKYRQKYSAKMVESQRPQTTLLGNRCYPKNATQSR